LIASCADHEKKLCRLVRATNSAPCIVSTRPSSICSAVFTNTHYTALIRMDNPILFTVVPILKAILELVAALCVAIGLARTLWLAWRNRATLNRPDTISQLRE
jgi:hypothetical protein